MPRNDSIGEKMVVIIDYQMGNIRSVQNALTKIGVESTISADPEIIRNAERIILPGVGAFGDGMEHLRRQGLLPLLEEEVLENKKPFLGICLGMQLLAKTSSENGSFEGLGWIPASVERLTPDNPDAKVPHVGWNDIQIKNKENIFSGVSEQPVFYFVHSFHMICEKKEDVLATCDYFGEFTSAVRRENIFGVQFHPEKSQKDGLALLKKFVEYQPAEELKVC